MTATSPAICATSSTQTGRTAREQLANQAWAVRALHLFTTSYRHDRARIAAVRTLLPRLPASLPQTVTVWSTSLMSEDGPHGERRADQRAAELDLREAALVAREAAVAEREAAVSVREKALAERMGDADEILAAGDERDVISDARDEGAEAREHYLDRAQFLAHDGNDTYGEKDQPKRRRAAARDRDHSKGDRTASRDDRIALTQDPDAPERPDHEDH